MNHMTIFYPIFKTMRVVKNVWRIVNTNWKHWFGTEIYSDILVDITCSSISSWKTIRFLEQIMSTDKYPSIFPRQKEAIV